MKIKNIILDLDETIISSIDVKEFNDNQNILQNKDEKYKNFDSWYIYQRPGLQEFLDFIFQNYNVTVWTAADKNYALFIINHFILTKPERKLNYIFFSYHCILSNKIYKNHKQLKLLWDHFNLNNFSQNDTIIIDDKIELTKNQPDNVFNIKPYSIYDQYSSLDNELKDIKTLIINSS